MSSKEKKGVMYWIGLLIEIGLVVVRGVRYFKKIGADTKNYAKSVWLTISVVRMEAAHLKEKAVKISGYTNKQRLWTLQKRIDYVVTLLKSKPILFGNKTDDQLASLVNDYIQGVR